MKFHDGVQNCCYNASSQITMKSYALLVTSLIHELIYDILMAGKDSKKLYVNIGNHGYLKKKKRNEEKSYSTSTVHNIALP